MFNFAEGEKPFACNKCPKAYASPARLRDHYYSHIGENLISAFYIAPIAFKSTGFSDTFDLT